MANPEHVAQIAGVSAAANDEFDAKHSEQVAVTLLKLHEQITLERSLARVQGEGAEAIRQVTLAAKIQAIQRGNDADHAIRTLIGRCSNSQRVSTVVTPSRSRARNSPQAPSEPRPPKI